MDIAELSVSVEMLKLAEFQLYVFRIQTSLAKKAYLEDQQLYFRAIVWTSAPLIGAEEISNTPDVVAAIALSQVDDFINARILANKYTKSRGEPTESDEQGRGLADKEKLRSVSKPAQIKSAYISSKNSKIFHKAECPLGKRIHKENLVRHKNRADATRAGKRPCKRCNP